MIGHERPKHSARHAFTNHPNRPPSCKRESARAGRSTSAPDWAILGHLCSTTFSHRHRQCRGAGLSLVDSEAGIMAFFDRRTQADAVSRALAIRRSQTSCGWAAATRPSHASICPMTFTPWQQQHHPKSQTGRVQWLQPSRNQETDQPHGGSPTEPNIPTFLPRPAQLSQHPWTTRRAARPTHAPINLDRPTYP
jgi:hypothetical protein